jgi:hypothetical protein
MPGEGTQSQLTDLAHETAHARMHFSERRTKTTKRIRETEAGAVAFAICNAIGLETGTASAPRAMPSFCPRVSNTFQQTAKRILTAIVPSPHSNRSQQD